MQNMSREETGLPREFLLKQIENHIQSGFALVAALRRTLEPGSALAADSTSQRVTGTSEEAGVESAVSAPAQVRELTNQLIELRQAFDRLTETQSAAASAK